jgi:hypothetical protein
MSDQGSPDLDQYGIFGGVVEGGDYQVLLDPLEKEFDLPGASVEPRHLEGGQVQAVGQKTLTLAVRMVDLWRGPPFRPLTVLLTPLRKSAQIQNSLVTPQSITRGKILVPNQGWDSMACTSSDLFFRKGLQPRGIGFKNRNLGGFLKGNDVLKTIFDCPGQIWRKISVARSF